MAEYRDIGYFTDDYDRPLIEVQLPKGQVYQATHEGEDRLPFMYRSFISFSFGERNGKRVNIEDFDLIAYTNGNRLSRSGYASFKDNTSSYDNLDGLYYWSTHFEALNLTLDLTTDGMTQKLLDNFLAWFAPGTTRELILSEHPNRAIMARVSLPPQLNLLPFEKDVPVLINGYEYMTKTTNFKGEITLDFVMDEPFWYAKDNILGIKDEAHGRYINDWIDPNGNQVNIFASQDALKIIYEDGIPLGSQIDDDMLLGNGMYANASLNERSKIWSKSETEANWATLGVGARIAANDNDFTRGIIAGAIIDISGNGITLLNGGDIPHAFFYYAGTAPSPIIISFQLTPTFSNHYVSTPANTYILNNDNPYNTFTIGSESGQQHLYFTTPNLLTSYNKVIEIFELKVELGMEWEKVYLMIRDEVRHPDVRKWARTIVKYCEVHTTYTSTSIAGTVLNWNSNTVCGWMHYMLLDASRADYPIIFTFNSKTGEATAEFKYRRVADAIPENNAAWSTWGVFLGEKQTIVENVGDMIRSNYLYIKDRNNPNLNGAIVAYLDNDEGGRAYSHYIIHDSPQPLEFVKILYLNLYL